MPTGSGDSGSPQARLKGTPKERTAVHRVSRVLQSRKDPSRSKEKNVYRWIRGEIEILHIVFLKTWEDLLSGHPIWFSGTILQLVLGKGLVYQEV